MNNQSANAFNAAAEEVNGSSMFAQGDVAIILKKDGSVQPLAIGFDMRQVREVMGQVGERPLTQEEAQIVEQGRRLMALLLGASNPAVMSILFDLMDDPEIYDPEQFRAMARRH